MTPPQTFQSSPRTELRPFWTSIALVGALAWFALSVGATSGALLLGGFDALIVAICIARGISKTTLVLDDDGFSWRALGRREFRCQWRNVDHFLAGRWLGWVPPKVAFNFREGRVPDQIEATAMNRATNGYDRSFANVWDIPTGRLVELMNKHSDRSQ